MVDWSVEKETKEKFYPIFGVLLFFLIVTLFAAPPLSFFVLVILILAAYFAINKDKELKVRRKVEGWVSKLVDEYEIETIPDLETVVVKVPKDEMSKIIGKDGARVRKMEKNTGWDVDVKKL